MISAARTEQLPCGPAPDGVDHEYWSGLDEGRLLLPQCTECDEWLPLGRHLCSRCWSFALGWSEVPMTGTVFTWIRTQRDFMSEFDVRAPYVTVLVDLDGCLVRVLGLLRDDSVAVGDRVHGVVEKPANAGWPLLRWKRDPA